jgi:hypothetical protein
MCKFYHAFARRTDSDERALAYGAGALVVSVAVLSLLHFA